MISQPAQSSESLKGARGLDSLLGPLVLTLDLLLLLGSEIILDVEQFANLLGGLALDHVGDGLAADVADQRKGRGSFSTTNPNPCVEAKELTARA